MRKKNKDSRDYSDSGGNEGKQEVCTAIFMMDRFFEIPRTDKREIAAPYVRL